MDATAPKQNSIAFTVPGPPVAKGRPRIGKRAGRAIAFTPKKTVTYESTVALFASQAMAGRSPMEGPVQIMLWVNMPIPPSWSKKKREAAGCGMPHTSRPDLDNLEKATTDAMNGIVYRDDSQIFYVVKAKRYSEIPGVEVQVIEQSCDLPINP